MKEEKIQIFHPTKNIIPPKQELQLINTESNSSYQYYTIKGQYKQGATRLVREYKGIAISKINTQQKKFITIFQLTQFDEGPFNQDQLPYSYQIYSEIISRLAIGKPLHQSILEIFDHYYEKKTHSLYLISQRCDLLNFLQKLPFFTEAEMIVALRNILEIFQYLYQVMPGKMKYFNIKDCLKINMESMNIKILDFGYSRDALAKFSGYVEEWNIFADPYSKAGTFLPGQEFYDIEGDLETKIQNFVCPAEFDNKYKEINKDAYAKPPSFVQTDHLWNAGLVLLYWFYEKFLPFDLEPKNCLKIQEALRKIRKQGISAIDKNLKPRRKITESWKIILDGLLTSKPPKIYTTNDVSKGLPANKNIFEIPELSYSKNRLFYWKCVMKKMQYTYIPFKYFKRIYDPCQVPSCHDMIPQNGMQKLQYRSHYSHKAIKYLISLPKILNNYKMEEHFLQKSQKQPLDVIKDNKCIVFMLSKAFIQLHEISHLLQKNKQATPQIDSQQGKDQKHFLQAKILKVISVCEQSSKKFYEEIEKIMKATNEDLSKLRQKKFEKNDRQSFQNDQKGNQCYREMEKKRQILNEKYYEENLKKNQAELAQFKIKQANKSIERKTISIREDVEVLNDFKGRNLKFYKESQKTEGILLWVQLLGIYNLGMNTLGRVIETFGEIPKINQDILRDLDSLEDYLNLVKVIQLSEEYDKFKSYIYSQIRKNYKFL